MAELRSESFFQAAWRQFRRHRLAMIGGGILAVLYFMAAFAGFFSTYDPNFYTFTPSFRYAPPTPIHFRDPETGRLTRPYVYRMKKELDLETFTDRYVEDKSKRYPIYFFVRTPSQPYTVFKLFKTDWRLFGLGEEATKEGARLFLLGADNFGRDLWSRMVYGGQVSLTVGILSVLIAMMIGLIMGGLAGYYQGTRIAIARPLLRPESWRLRHGQGVLNAAVSAIREVTLIIASVAFWGGLAVLLMYGYMLLRDYSTPLEQVIWGFLLGGAALWSLAHAILVPLSFDPDDLVMRLVEILAAIPFLFLLITLRAAFPMEMDPLGVFYLVVAILAFVGWGGLARAIRGMVLSIREVDFVTAAKATGVPEFWIIMRHILPATASYVIVYASLAIPGFILAESGLSFLGLGITEPYTSWGLLLKAAQDGGFASFSDRPWVLAPGFAIFIAVLSWNFVGDGLRDAFDPRRRK